MSKVCNVAAPITSVNGITIDRSKACDPSNYGNMASRTVKYLVFHYTGNHKDNAKNNANYFMGANREASAHYFVDDTSIYQSVDINDRAWHCGTKGSFYHPDCRNSNSIGIEMCCTAGNYKIGEKALENAARLGAALCKYLGITDIDTYVVRHYDVTHKKCPAQMAGENNAEWDAFKKRIKSLLNAETASTPSITPTVNYKVKVTANVLNIRSGPGTKYDVVGKIKDGGVYTIIEESKDGKWGLLKSYVDNRNGWISLNYTKKV